MHALPAVIVLVAAMIAPAAHARAQEKTPAAPEQPQTAETYAAQLKEYDLRVAQQREWNAQQERQWWVSPAITLAILAVFLFVNQRSAKRRVAELLKTSQESTERALRQNERMIELLKSIDDRLGRDTPTSKEAR